jgi:hypothetical protein
MLFAALFSELLALAAQGAQRDDANERRERD